MERDLSEMKKIRFAFVGTGKIAFEHAKVIHALGHLITVAISRTENKQFKAFCSKFDIKNKYSTSENFILNKDKYDAIIICTPWYITENIIENYIPLNKPILVEKPLTLSLKKFNYLQENYNLNNLLVAFNRRYYDFIPYIKEILKNEKVLHIDALSSEPFSTMDSSHNLNDNMLYFYSIHLIDLLSYLLGNLELINVIKVPYKDKTNYIVELFSEELKCPIQLKILLDINQNSFIKFYGVNNTIELLPFEKLRIYDKITKKTTHEGTEYFPNLKEEFKTSSEFKAGFLNQINFFITHYIQKENFSNLHLTEISKVIDLCDNIKEKALQHN